MREGICPCPCLPFNLHQPDLTVLLTVSPAIQAQRFLVRGMSAGDRRMINVQDELLKSYRRLFDDGVPGMKTEIDTDHLSPSDVADRIISLMNANN